MSTAKLNSLHTLLQHELQELLSFEQQLTEALPQLIEIANDEWLKKEIAGFESKSRRHIETLKEAFAELGMSAGDHQCRAMAGLIDEALELGKRDAEPHVRDAALISILQRIGHLGMAAYATAAAFAHEVGHHQVGERLKQCWKDENEANSSMGSLATRWVNFMAAHASTGQS
ncbi:MAG: YciE/YciF family protein [Pirellulaceae bacterium]|nr:MAG: YciE/YciF family protein [Pirellulaceae bacterium]